MVIKEKPRNPKITEKYETSGKAKTNEDDKKEKARKTKKTQEKQGEPNKNTKIKKIKLTKLIIQRNPSC